MSTVFHNILRAADKRYARRFAVLGAVFLAVLLGSLLVGRYALSPGQLVHMLWARVTGGAADWPISDDKVVFAVRLPRVAAAALVGAALAVSGAAYQGMFRNPMVSPDILGASTGAGFGYIVLLEEKEGRHRALPVIAATFATAVIGGTLVQLLIG